MNHPRGFTLLELVIVLSLGVILVPIMYSFGSYMDEQRALATFHLDVADGTRTIAEELRADARTSKVMAGEGIGFLRGHCEIRYVVNEDSVLVRRAADACGGARGLSHRVESIVGSRGGVDVTFARAMRPDRAVRTTIFIPVEGR